MNTTTTKKKYVMMNDGKGFVFRTRIMGISSSFLFIFIDTFVCLLSCVGFVLDYYCCYNNTQITRHGNLCGKIFSMHTKKLSLLSVGKCCFS